MRDPEVHFLLWFLMILLDVCEKVSPANSPAEVWGYERDPDTCLKTQYLLRYIYPDTVPAATRSQ